MLSDRITSSGLAALLLTAAGVSSTSFPAPDKGWKRAIPTAKCKTHLLIDDFNTWANGENTLKGATSGKRNRHRPGDGRGSIEPMSDMHSIPT
jgi:hypothetical protein